MKRNNNTKLDHCDLRDEINKIFVDYFNHEEAEMYKTHEYDHKYQKYCTDKILELIRNQGGTY